MSTAATKTAALRRLAVKGLVRARDLVAAEIPRSYLGRLVERGVLERAGRGIYRLVDADVSELHSLAQVSKRVPHGTVCLLSALQAHGLTTELPHSVWIMIDSGARTPNIDTPAVDVVRAGGRARTHGVITKRIDGVDVPLTDPAKTVADCFRYRRRVGLDVAIAALRAYLMQTKARRAAARSWSVDALVDAAQADEVFSVMRPYLEALA